MELTFKKNESMKDDVQRSLGRIEGKLEEGFLNINKRLDGVNGSIKAHDTKINDLETFRDNLQGRMSIIGAIAGVIGAFITMLFNRFINKN